MRWVLPLPLLLGPLAWLPAAEPDASVPAEAVPVTPAKPKGQSGEAPQPDIEYLYLPSASATNADGHESQGELRVKVGAPPWWRSGSGEFGSVLGAGYGRIDVDQEGLDLPSTLQSAYLNSVSFWNFSESGSASLILTPGIRTADTSIEWADTRLFVGAFTNWRLDSRWTLGVGAVSTSNHLKTVTIPIASIVWRPTDDVTVWFQGIAAQVQWKVVPAWTVGGSYSLISSLDYQLPANDPDGEIIIQRDIRVLGNARWNATRMLSIGGVLGGAFRRSFRWDGDGPTRDNLELSPALIVGGTLFLRFF